MSEQVVGAVGVVGEQITGTSGECAAVMPTGIVDAIISKIVEEVLPGLVISALDKLGDWAKSVDWAALIDQLVNWVKSYVIKPVLG